MLKNKTLMFDI